MRRPLPDDQHAREILARKRTRPARKPAPPAGRSLAPLIRKLDAQFGYSADALDERWPEIVGEALGRVSQPIKFIKGPAGKGGTLEIRVAGPAAIFVQHQSTTILERLNLVLGEGAVRQIRLSQGPIKARPGHAKPPPKRAKPLDAAAEAELGDQLADIDDPKLRNALERLGRSILSS